jgi:hypothetical protein
MRTVFPVLSFAYGQIAVYGNLMARVTRTGINFSGSFYLGWPGRSAGSMTIWTLPG